jgi:hypothetical protein
VRGVAFLFLLPTAAAARDLPARLNVERAPGAEQCPEQRQLVERVEGILRRPLQNSVDTSALTVDVRFERSAAGSFVARVSSTGPKPGQRLLRDTNPTCDPLAEAVSVAIALLLDSALEQAKRSEQVSAPAPSQPETQPSSTPPLAEAGAGRAALTRRWSARAALEAGGGYGLGGDGAWLGFGRLGARHGGWLLDLGGGGNLPTERGFDGGRVRTSLLFGSLRVCYLLGHSPSIAPCVQVAAGRLRGEGRGYGQVQRSTLPWTAGGLGLAAETPLAAGVYATLGATLWVPTRRQTFSVENAGIAWESKAVAGVLTAGLGLSLF